MCEDGEQAHDMIGPARCTDTHMCPVANILAMCIVAPTSTHVRPEFVIDCLWMQTVAHARMEQQLYGGASRTNSRSGGTATTGGGAALARDTSGRDLAHQPSWATERVLVKTSLSGSGAVSAGGWDGKPVHVQC
jgi:hypothetical protein